MPDKHDTPIDMRIARLATRQHGVVSAKQLTALGLNGEAIAYRVAKGRLHRVARGVYAVGHTALRWEAAYVRAVMVGGRTSALTGAHAAAWWAIRPRPSGRVHVIVPGTNGRRRHREGVVIHRSRSLRPGDIVTHDGLRVTTPARTLLDYAGSSPRHLLDRAVEKALQRDMVDDSVHDLIAANPQAPGRTLLLELLRYHGDQPRWTQSDFEAFIVDLCRTHGIPLPLTNVPVLGDVVDAWWPNYRLVAEPDGMADHGTPAAAIRDRAKDGKRMAEGIITLRFTWLQAQKNGRACAAAISGAMRR